MVLLLLLISCAFISEKIALTFWFNFLCEPHMCNIELEYSWAGNSPFRNKVQWKSGQVCKKCIPNFLGHSFLSNGSSPMTFFSFSVNSFIVPGWFVLSTHLIIFLFLLVVSLEGTTLLPSTFGEIKGIFSTSCNRKGQIEVIIP